MTKRILLIIGGGIAAYKTLFLIRLLAQRNIATRVILTRSGAEFITPLSASALSGDKVYSNLWNLTDEAEMGHIELSRSADLIVVAPATADILAKAAHGIATDLATTTLLATDKQILYAPAMNVRMWEAAPTQRNIAQLKTDGAFFVGPEVGDMACGEQGAGRMAEPQALCEAIVTALNRPTDFESMAAKPLAGKQAIITAGPTRESIDRVRYLSNHSSGKQGYAIAQALTALGARVHLISGPVSLPPPPNVETIHVQTAHEMLAATQQALPADIFIAVAAVADWHVRKPTTGKIKKNKQGIPTLALVENPDILATICQSKTRPALVIGFAAETDHILDYAQTKRKQKGCDWIVANDVSGDVMGGDYNHIHLIRSHDHESWPRLSKYETAHKLAAAIALHFETPDNA